MKIKLNFILAAGLILFSCSTVFSQITGGGAGSGEGNSNRTPSKDDKGVFDNAFYLRTGFSIPVGIFGEKPQLPFNIIDTYNGTVGTGAVSGGVFEMGTIFYIRSIPIQEQFKIGIDVSWIDISWNNINWDHLGPVWKESVEFIPYIISGMKIGPVFSYNPVDQLIIDAFYKLGPASLAGGNIDAHIQEDAYNSYSYSVEPDPAVGFRHALGFNVRYNLLMLGLEYNSVTVTRDVNENVSEQVDGDYSYGSDFHEVETPVKTMRLTFGLKF